MEDGEEIKEQLNLVDEEAQNMSVGEICKFLIFSILFVVITLNQTNTSNSYYIAAGIKDVLTAEDYDSILVKEDLIEWILEDFVPTISEDIYYTGWYIKEDFHRVAWSNKIITPVRFVQKRMDLIDNPNDRTSDLYSKIWAGDELGPYDIKDEESTDDFGEYDENDNNFNEICGNDYSMFKYDDSIGVDESGGYEYLLDLKNDNITSCAQQIIEDMKWIDEQSAAFYMDFAFYNGAYDMMGYVVFEFTIKNTGLVEKHISIRSIKTEFYREIVDMVRACFEVMYVALVLIYTIIELIEIKGEFEDEKIRLENEGQAAAKCLMFWTGLKAHFSNLWNLLDVASLILSYVAIGAWFFIAFNDVVEEKEVAFSSESIDIILHIIKDLKLYIRLNSFNMLLIFVRVIKYLGRFERIRLLQQTFVRAKGEIFYFFVLLLGIFTSFVIFGYVAFGNMTEKYSDFGKSVVSCLLMLLNDMSTVLELLVLDFNTAAIYMIMFTLMINFILTNMFIAIISTAYSDELDALEEKTKDRKEKEKEHILFKVKNQAILMWYKFVGCFSEKRALIEKYKKKERVIHNDVDEEVIRVKDENLEYQQVKDWGADINEEVLNDKEKYEKISETTQTLNKKLWSAVIFICFTLIYTLVVIFQQDIETKYNLTNSLRSAIESSIYIDDDTIEDVVDYNNLSLWLTSALPDMINYVHESTIEHNFVVGQNILKDNRNCSTEGGPMRLIVRKVEETDNPSAIFEESFPTVREKGFDPDDPSTHEYTETDHFVNCTWSHSSEGGLSNSGGYFFYLTAIDDFFNMQMSNLTEQRFLNDTFNSATVDFVVYNGDLNYFTYVAIIFYFNGSGKLQTDYEIWPMRLKMYHTPGDIVRAIFEFVYLALLVYHILLTIRTIKYDNKNYEYWRTRFYQILTTEQIRKRNKAKPEWLRRVTNILTMYIAIDLFSYTCSVLCIGYWIAYLCSGLPGFELTTDEKDFHDEFNYESEILKYYLTWTSLNLLFIYVRILNYVSLDKGLRFLEETVGAALTDIVFFLIILLSIMMGFVIMAYLTFGVMLFNYHTIYMSFFTCFAMIIGAFNYYELEEGDPVLAGIFFFVFTIFTTYILLNIFIAILERAYSKIKEEQGSQERINYIESLIISIIKQLKILINKRKEMKKNDLKLPLALLVFDRLDTGLEPEEDPQSWAEKQSEDILMERFKRNEVYQALEELFRERKEREIENAEMLFEKDNDITMEFSARFDYWQYLRTGFLRLLAEEKKIKVRTQEIIKKNLSTYQTFQNLEEDKNKIIMKLKPIIDRHDHLKAEYEKLISRRDDLEEQKAKREYDDS